MDFHSWRRWFIRKAVDALAKGAKGYTPWTIASVVGHKVEGSSIEGVLLPLGMTMGRYPGAAPFEEMTACVRAVMLPSAKLAYRADLTRRIKLQRRKPQHRTAA